MSEQTAWPSWADTPGKRAANVDYWRAHNERCRALNRVKYAGERTQLVIYVKLVKFEYRMPLPLYRTAR